MNNVTLIRVIISMINDFGLKTLMEEKVIEYYHHTIGQGWFS